MCRRCRRASSCWYVTRKRRMFRHRSFNLPSERSLRSKIGRKIVRQCFVIQRLFYVQAHGDVKGSIFIYSALSFFPIFCFSTVAIKVLSDGYIKSVKNEVLLRVFMLYILQICWKSFKTLHYRRPCFLILLFTVKRLKL